jgi:hypothetical protein
MSSDYRLVGGNDGGDGGVVGGVDGCADCDAGRSLLVVVAGKTGNHH